MQPSQGLQPAGRPRRLRGVVFRIAAVMFGLSSFALAEGLFAILDWGRPDYAEDPFMGFSEVHPLFVLDDEGSRYEIPLSRQGFFCPESFAAQKGAGEFRIFCLGGSTVRGRPYDVETSFTTWLEISLQAADPQRQWNAINCGGVSYASYRLVPILQEVLQYEPDLIILYTGHNEFLEDRTYGHIKNLPWIVTGPGGLISRTRTFTLLREGYRRLRGRPYPAQSQSRPILGEETDAILEHQGGLEQYHRDEKWRRDVIQHFDHNLRRMVALAQDAGVPVLLVNPVCNLRDCPPFKQQHRDGLTREELQQWESLVAQAGQSAYGDEHGRGRNLLRAVEYLQQALAVDDRQAGIHYLLAGCYDSLGKMDEARQSYIRAKEHDICPLRIIEPMSEAVLQTARQTGTPLVDVRKMFEQLSDVGIPGDDFLIDWVHPSIESHQLIADALAEELVRQGVVKPGPNWQEERERRYRQHHDSLPSIYFPKGLERLEALRCWSQGLGDHPPLK